MLEEIISIVREAGKLVPAAWDVSARTHKKTSAADLVAEYDIAVEDFLRERLLALLPEAVFFGETTWRDVLAGCRDCWMCTGNWISERSVPDVWQTKKTDRVALR